MSEQRVPEVGQVIPGRAAENASHVGAVWHDKAEFQESN